MATDRERAPDPDGPQTVTGPDHACEPAKVLPPVRERLLTPKEERELSDAAHNGDDCARTRLVEANMRLVISIARRYQCFAVPFEDLVQEGAIGLMTACQRYDPALGFRFSTYATHWIRQAIIRAIDTKARAIRIPTHVSDGLRRIERSRQELIRETGAEPTIALLAERAGMSVRRVTAYLKVIQDPVSLDGLVGGDDRVSLAALLSDPNASDPENTVLDTELQREIAEILDSLSEREREVLRRRFGFDGDDGQVLRDIGAEFGISRERVRQIEAKALGRVRVAARRRRLADYLAP
jgi:RNA polymerase primary sigma factor